MHLFQVHGLGVVRGEVIRVPVLDVSVHPEHVWVLDETGVVEDGVVVLGDVAVHLTQGDDLPKPLAAVHRPQPLPQHRTRKHSKVLGDGGV